MQKYLILYAVIVTALLAVVIGRSRGERQRLLQNQTALAADVEHYRTQFGQEAASAQALRLRCAEYEELRAADAEEIRALGIRLRRVEAAGKNVTRTDLDLRAPLRDTLLVRQPTPKPASGDPIGNPFDNTFDNTFGDNMENRSGSGIGEGGDAAAIRRHAAPPIVDTARIFRWRDPWVTVEGLIAGDSVRCRVQSVDTLRQVVHRIPRRFLFIRWGTKALRQEIVSSNPHTRIVYTEYVRIER